MLYWINTVKTLLTVIFLLFKIILKKQMLLLDELPNIMYNVFRILSLLRQLGRGTWENFL